MNLMCFLLSQAKVYLPFTVASESVNDKVTFDAMFSRRVCTTGRHLPFECGQKAWTN